MASLQSSLLQSPFAISSLTLVLFLISLPPSILSQAPGSSTPTIAQCTTRLLPLAACAPFVQGTAISPAQSCCDNLQLLYSQQPDCLCLLLNDTTLSNFPINATRALQLPALCSVQADISACSGGVNVPPSTPSSQVSLGANTNSTAANSTVAASPMSQNAPRPSMMGLGFGRSASASTESKMGTYLPVALAMAVFLVTEILV